MVPSERRVRLRIETVSPGLRKNPEFTGTPPKTGDDWPEVDRWKTDLFSRKAWLTGHDMLFPDDPPGCCLGGKQSNNDDEGAHSSRNSATDIHM